MTSETGFKEVKWKPKGVIHKYVEKCFPFFDNLPTWAWISFILNVNKKSNFWTTYLLTHIILSTYLLKALTWNLSLKEEKLHKKGAFSLSYTYFMKHPNLWAKMDRSITLRAGVYDVVEGGANNGLQI